jgi:hypothetical protein
MISLSESSGRVTDSKSASVLVPFAPGHDIDGFLGASSRAVSRRQVRMPISAMAAHGGRRSIREGAGSQGVLVSPFLIPIFRAGARAC